MSTETLIMENRIEELPPLDDTLLYSYCHCPKLPFVSLSRHPITTPVLHLLVATGHLDKIPNDLRTAPKALRHTDPVGRNIYHIAAATGQLNKLPELTLRRLANKASHPYTPIAYAAANKHLDQIPPNIIKRAMLSGIKFTETAVKYGSLEQLPAELLVPKYFCVNSPFHQIDVYNNLALIPKQLMVEKVLQQTNWSGNTVMHMAAAKGQKIPDIDLELFLITNATGKTALETFITSDTIDAIISRPWPESFEPIVGPSIWAAHKALMRQETEIIEEQPDIDLF